MGSFWALSVSLGPYLWVEGVWFPSQQPSPRLMTPENYLNGSEDVGGEVVEEVMEMMVVEW